jgi:hypothetical protein
MAVSIQRTRIFGYMEGRTSETRFILLLLVNIIFFGHIRKSSGTRAVVAYLQFLTFSPLIVITVRARLV